MAVDQGYFGDGEIDLDEPNEENLLDEITSYFDGTDEATEDSFVSIQLD